jgi:hypothetical protein
MRRILTAAALATAVIAGVTACGGTPDPAASPTAAAASAAPATSAAAAAAGADTKAVCAEAVALSSTAAADFAKQIDEFLKSVVAGGDDAAAAEKKLRASLTAWEAKLKELAAKDIDPELKTALTEAAATVAKHNDPNDNTGTGAVKKEFTEIGAKITTACA